MSRKYPGSLVLFLMFFFILSGITLAQDYHFKTYSTEDGLSNRFVYTINQDESGFLWIGTGSGLSRFDGIEFRSDFLPDSLAEISYVCSYRDSTGSLWFGTNNGMVVKYSDGAFRLYDLGEYTSGAITGLIEGVEGDIIASTQSGGIVVILPGSPAELIYRELDAGLIFSIGKAPNGRLMVGTNDGLLMFSFPHRNNTPQLISKIEGIPSTRINCIHIGQYSGRMFVGTEDKGLYMIAQGRGEDKLAVKDLTAKTGFNRANIRELTETGNGELWISLFRGGLLKIFLDEDINKITEYRQFNNTNGLVNNNTQSVFMDHERNIWTGTAGSGLAMLMDEAITFLAGNEQVSGKSITAIDNDDKYYYLAGDKGIAVYSKNDFQLIESFDKKNGLPDDRITAIDLDGDILWTGTAGSGLYKFSLKTKKASAFFVSNDDNEKYINDIVREKNNLWLATNSGIFNFDLSGDMKDHFSTSQGLPHNSISHLFIDDENRLWISTLSDVLYYLEENKLVKSDFPSAGIRIDFRQITRSDKGDIWAATYGNGVLHFTSDTVFSVTKETGLLSNYCYSIFKDNLNRIWVGHRQGFSRISGEKKLIHTCGQERGILGDANPNSGLVEDNGKVILGTSQGVLIYDQRMEKANDIAPVISINSVSFNDTDVPVSGRIVMPYSSYKLKVDFIGISFNKPEDVVYKYKLDNYDSEWSDYTSLSEAVYNRLDDGVYKFMLYAYNTNYVSSAEAYSFDIIVRKPFWKSLWFYILLTAALVAMVIWIIKYRERKQKKLQIFLEKELDERTKEVVEQKDEIELKNKEITDSINYAQRIQASILPPLQKLKDNLPASFVFYRPRDIVSGDFYWWDRVDKDRFMIVCADSTGHGVPGAFMSMIGSTLIKDIVGRKPNIKPSDLLKALDEEITASLNQNTEGHISNDGMDIIACEFNLKTKYMRFSSAMRPIIMFHKDEQYYLRGNRSSIGGDTILAKTFEDQEYQLAEGDVVYLFSDGYPDQFGGPLGKKLKMLRLKNLLEDIHKKDMDEQYKHIERNFDIWKGDLDQVDDVLFMGIKI